MKYIRSHFGIKLFASYFLIILIAMGAVWVASLFTSPRAYQQHLFFMEQSLGQGNGMGPMMGLGQGQGAGQGNGFGQGGGMLTEFYRNYQASFNQSLILAVIVASAVALAASFFISRNIIAPVRRMMTASRRIAEGHYDERVSQLGGDELGQLAMSFNQMAEQLEHVEAMRRRLIGDVTHELRTPLTSIKGFAEGLMDGVLPASDETYQQIHAEAERLNRLVDDLQELSRVESNATHLELRSVDANAAVGTVLKRMKFQFDEQRVALTSSLPRDPLYVLADEDRLLQVLTNLLGNALQYTPENGEVDISLAREKNMAGFAIRDTGVGIPPEHLAHIFDRFYRVDKSRSRTHGGSGIGLTIAKHLIEAQDGKIWAESEGENKGSVFIFTLPMG